MGMTAGDRIVQRLSEWGVRRVFGYPGDGINGIMGGFQHVDEPPRFVLARHEEMAAFMACGHAKFTGEVGVCLATSGPGAIHLLNGLYDAKMDHQPVVAIVGQQARTALGGHYQQEVDLVTLFKDVASEYLQLVSVSQQLPAVLDRAFRIARAQRTVTCVIVPADLQEESYEEPEHAFKMLPPEGIGYQAPRVLPPEDELRRAAEILNERGKIAILIGQGAAAAADEVLELADLLGTGVAKALLGKDALPDTLPYVTGAIGLLGTRPSYEMMMDCDALLMIGTSFPYTQFLPEPHSVPGIQIELDARMIGIRYPMDVHLVGDSKETLRALMPLLKRKDDRSWRQTIEAGVADWWKLIEARAMTDAQPLNPQRVFWDLSPRLPERCIITTDSGSAANWFARDLKIREGMRASLSGNLATMGPGVPYAIAAKFAYPERVVMALVGDGAMQMNGNAELITISQYWQEWDDPRLIVLILHNNDLNQVTWEQRAFAGDPKFVPSQHIVDFPYARYAELLGLRGIRVDAPDQVGPAWDEALRADRPVVLEAMTDPEVPPLPPHVELEQAKAMVSAILKGDPEAARIIKQGFLGKIKEFMPGKGS